MKQTKISADQILRVAMQQFIENGYNETTVRSIAKELNISHGSIFNFFASKADIALNITSAFFHAWIQSVNSILNQQEDISPLERFSFLAVVNFSFIYNNKRLGIFIRDFLVNHHFLFLDSEQHYLTNYVQQHAKNYAHENLLAKMDVLLLDVASSHLYTMIFEDNVSIRDASVYSTNLVNFLWRLGYDEKLIAEAVDSFVKDTFLVNQAVNLMNSDLQKISASNQKTGE